MVWTKNTLSSISAPPLQLVSVVGIVMFLLFVPSYINFKSTVQTTTMSFHMFILILPLLLIFTAYFLSKCGPRLVLPVGLFGRRLEQSNVQAGGGSSPWGVAVLVLLLLVLASKLSNFRSMWSPLIWRPH